MSEMNVKEQHNSGINALVAEFNAIMSSNHQVSFEELNRSNKGELFVLHCLTMRKTALPSELSVALHSSEGRISAVLGALEKKGQIERKIDQSNRRKIQVSITSAGRKRVQAEFAKREQALSQTFVEMGETDAGEFVRLAQKFFTVAQKYMTECAHHKKVIKGKLK